MAGDMSMRKLPFEKRADYLFKKLVTQSDTKTGIKFTISGAVQPKSTSFISEAALKTIRERHPKFLKGHDFILTSTHPDLRIEHTIPVEYMYKHLVHLLETGDLSKNTVLSAIKAACIAIITPEEDAMLNRASLNDTMPDGFVIGVNDPLERYEKAGIVMHKW